MDRGFTPVVEIVFSGTGDTVIKYPYEGLVLIAIIENETGADRPWSEVEELSRLSGIRLAKVFHFQSIEEVLEKKKWLLGTEEGFVILFANGLRVKVKGDQYLLHFRALQGLTTGVVLEAMKIGNEDYFRTLSEEIRPLAEEIRAAIEAQRALIRSEALNVVARSPKGVSRKEIAAWMTADSASFEAKELAFLIIDGRDAGWRWYRRINERAIRVRFGV